MLENRRYEDYEELGRYIQEALKALKPSDNPDLHRANNALKEAVDKAFAMWHDDPTIQTTLDRLHSLHAAVDFQPRVEVEQPEREAPVVPQSPKDSAYMVNDLLWELRGSLNEAFERDARAHRAFANRLTTTPMGWFYSPLYSEEENEGM
jgi:hypothetical protein